MIGLFGGSFDPIHLGHLRPALEVFEGLALQELRFVPAYRSPLKAGHGLTPEQRAAMVSAAISGQPGFVADLCELQRSGPSYTADTLAAKREQYGSAQSLCFIMGSDSFNNLPKWHQWQSVLELAHVVVMQRPDADIDTQLFPRDYVEQRLQPDAAKLREQPAGLINFQQVSQLDISSTMIRAHLREGRSIRYLVPDAQAEFIHRNHLYR